MGTVSILVIIIFCVVFMMMIFSGPIEDHNGRMRYRQYKAFTNAKNADLGHLKQSVLSNEEIERYARLLRGKDISNIRKVFSNADAKKIERLLNAESKNEKSSHKALNDRNIEKLRQSFNDEEVEEIVELLFATDEFDQQFK